MIQNIILQHEEDVWIIGAFIKKTDVNSFQRLIRKPYILYIWFQGMVKRNITPSKLTENMLGLNQQRNCAFPCRSMQSTVIVLDYIH